MATSVRVPFQEGPMGFFSPSSPSPSSSAPLAPRKPGLIWLKNSNATIHHVSTSQQSISTNDVYSPVASYLAETGQLEGPRDAPSTLFSAHFHYILDQISTGTRNAIEVAGESFTVHHVEAICAALRTRESRAATGTCEPIRALRLARCGLDNDMLARLLQSMPYESLRTLGLWWNTFDSNSVQLLMGTIAKCHQLGLLDLYGNAKLTSVWPGQMEKLYFHESLTMVGLGGTAVPEAERTLVRERLRMMHSTRTKVLTVLCSAQTRVGKSSKLRILPMDLIRELGQMLYMPPPSL